MTYIYNRETYNYNWYFKYDNNGEYHCDDGPAIIGKNKNNGKIEYIEWYKHGKCHREKYPARFVFKSNFTIIEYVNNGYVQRLDGPAKMSSIDGGKFGESYAIRGIFFNTDRFNFALKLIKNGINDEDIKRLSKFARYQLIALSQYFKENNEENSSAIIEGELVMRYLEKKDNVVI